MARVPPVFSHPNAGAGNLNATGGPLFSRHTSMYSERHCGYRLRGLNCIPRGPLGIPRRALNTSGTCSEVVCGARSMRADEYLFGLVG
eukprot:2839472-Pyramimonas_sp.AAC.3